MAWGVRRAAWAWGFTVGEEVWYCLMVCPVGWVSGYAGGVLVGMPGDLCQGESGSGASLDVSRSYCLTGKCESP